MAKQHDINTIHEALQIAITVLRGIREANRYDGQDNELASICKHAMERLGHAEHALLNLAVKADETEQPTVKTVRFEVTDTWRDAIATAKKVDRRLFGNVLDRVYGFDDIWRTLDLLYGQYMIRMINDSDTNNDTNVEEKLRQLLAEINIAPSAGLSCVETIARTKREITHIIQQLTPMTDDCDSEAP